MRNFKNESKKHDNEKTSLMNILKKMRLCKNEKKRKFEI